MSGGVEVHQQIEDFLLSKGILPHDQDPRYQIEIAYRMGYEDAVRNYAVWRDGEQVVGAMCRPLKAVLAEFSNEQVPLRYT